MKYLIFVRIVYSNGQAHVFEKMQAPIRMGRAGFCEIVIKGKTVEPIHCQLGWKDPQRIQTDNDEEQDRIDFSGVYLENVSSDALVGVNDQTVGVRETLELLFGQSYEFYIAKNKIEVTVQPLRGKPKNYPNPLMPGYKNKPRGESSYERYNNGPRSVNRGGRPKQSE